MTKGRTADFGWCAWRRTFGAVPGRRQGMATQLFVDLYGCSRDCLNESETVRRIARRGIQYIGAEIVEECVHSFEPVGVTYIAVITTSHFSIHTWPEYGYAAVDVFSCREDVPKRLAERLQEAFGAERCVTRTFERDIQEKRKGD